MIAPVIDGRLRSLDMTTGKTIWETRVSPENHGLHHHHGAARDQGRQSHRRRERRRVRRSAASSTPTTLKPAKRHGASTPFPAIPPSPSSSPNWKTAAKTWTNEWWKIGGGGPVWGGVAYDRR